RDRAGVHHPGRGVRSALPPGADLRGARAREGFRRGTGAREQGAVVRGDEHGARQQGVCVVKKRKALRGVPHAVDQEAPRVVDSEGGGALMGGRVGSPTDSQRKFVERYLAHGNARRAAREAGYPERRGAAMLTTRVVGDMVRSAQQKAAQRSTMNRDEALDRASDIARKGQDKDAINALKLLAALCGWEAAKKH